MALNEAQIVATELEHVDEVLPTLFDREDRFFAKLEKRPVIKVSNRAMRIPLELDPGGDFAHFDPDGGDLGTGDGPNYQVATLQPAFLREAIQWTKKAEWATDDKRKAIIDLVRQLTSKSMQEFRRNLDSLSMTDGTGTMGTVTSLTTTVLTNDTILLNTDGFNARLLRYGMRINIYNSTLATQRTTGTLPTIIFYDLANKTIQINQTVTGITGGDLVVVAGLNGANPQSIFGVKYHHSNASTGTWLGYNRATTPEIRANAVAAGGAFVLPFARLARNKVGDRVGMDTVKKVKAWMHPCQKQAYEQVGQLVSIIHKQPKDEALDMYFGDNMQMAGAPVEESFSWDKTRIDFIYEETWGRAEMHPCKFYDVDGRKIFELRGASGGVATSQIFYITIAFQEFVRNPAACVYINTLSIPSGY
jgi:hypothetical protein